MEKAKEGLETVKEKAKESIEQAKEGIKALNIKPFGWQVIVSALLLILVPTFYVLPLWNQKYLN